MKLGEVCIHGSLKRSCETCEIADERDKLLQLLAKERDEFARKETAWVGKTQFCAQCESYAKERDALLEKWQILATDSHSLEIDRDTWRSLCEELVEVLREVSLPPYHDSDLASLLETLKIHAQEVLLRYDSAKRGTK